jgi:high frequency lysogenization protein
MSFSPAEYDRIIALAAMVQTCNLVQSIAHTGQFDAIQFQTLLTSMLATNPDSTEAVYNGLNEVKPGLNQLNKLLSKNKAKDDITTLRMMISLMTLQNKLVKNKEMMDLISQEIDSIPKHIDYFGSISSPQVIARFADIYHKTLSTLSPTIHVHGNQTFLQQSDNVNRIRALLLAGVRSSILWQQKGGRRWHFVFKSSAIMSIATELYNRD